MLEGSICAVVVNGPVTHHEVASAWALNLVARDPLGSKVFHSHCLDNYGKSLSARVLAFEPEVPDVLQGELRVLR